MTAPRATNQLSVRVAILVRHRTPRSADDLLASTRRPRLREHCAWLSVANGCDGVRTERHSSRVTSVLTPRSAPAVVETAVAAIGRVSG
ncbi:hypothetical protein GCM10017687_81090 [Streptomyces echinatus]